jgi:hypothetical protein
MYAAHPKKFERLDAVSGKRCHSKQSQAWNDIEAELTHALDLYLNTNSSQEHGLAYHDTMFCLDDAIATAQNRPEDMTLNQLWEETADAIKGFHETEERRREFLEPMEVDEMAGPAGEDAGVEVETRGKRRIDFAIPSSFDSVIPSTFTWQLFASSPKRSADPFETTTAVTYAAPTPSHSQPPKSYTFPPIQYNDNPPHEKDPTVQRFYADVVTSTLNNLMNGMESRDVEYAVFACAAWVRGKGFGYKRKRKE